VGCFQKRQADARRFLCPLGQFVQNASLVFDAHRLGPATGDLREFLDRVEPKVQREKPLPGCRMKAPRVGRRTDAAKSGQVNDGGLVMGTAGHTNFVFGQCLEQDRLGHLVAGQGVDFVDEQDGILFKLDKNAGRILKPNATHRR